MPWSDQTARDKNDGDHALAQKWAETEARKSDKTGNGKAKKAKGKRKHKGTRLSDSKGGTKAEKASKARKKAKILEQKKQEASAAQAEATRAAAQDDPWKTPRIVSTARGASETPGQAPLSDAEDQSSDASEDSVDNEPLVPPLPSFARPRRTHADLGPEGAIVVSDGDVNYKEPDDDDDNDDDNDDDDDDDDQGEDRDLDD
jgi:hypothetical protein